MSKLLRSELKSIVKECLIEILSEGIGGDTLIEHSKKNSNFLNENNVKRKTKDKIPARTKSYLDNIKFEKKQTDNNFRSSPIKNTKLTNDPILNELLADTANTTLKEQVAADSKRRTENYSTPADAAALKVSNSMPEDLFGDTAAGKWAKLAFFDQ